MAQTNPSCPALCRQDTTSPWSTDHGGNIFCKILKIMPALIFSKEKKKNTNEKSERGAHPQMVFSQPPSLSCPPTPKNRILTKGNRHFLQKQLFDDFLPFSASKKEKRKNEKLEKHQKINEMKKCETFEQFQGFWASSAKSSTISRGCRCCCQFFRRNIDDFHDLFSECDFPRRKRSTRLGEEKGTFFLDVSKDTHFTFWKLATFFFCRGQPLQQQFFFQKTFSFRIIEFSTTPPSPVVFCSIWLLVLSGDQEGKDTTGRQ